MGKDAFLKIRATQEELYEWREVARVEGKEFSEWVRGRLGVREEIVPKVEKVEARKAQQGKKRASAVSEEVPEGVEEVEISMFSGALLVPKKEKK